MYLISFSTLFSCKTAVQRCCSNRAWSHLPLKSIYDRLPWIILFLFPCCMKWAWRLFSLPDIAYLCLSFIDYCKGPLFSLLDIAYLCLSFTDYCKGPFLPYTFLTHSVMHLTCFLFLVNICETCSPVQFSNLLLLVYSNKLLVCYSYCCYLLPILFSFLALSIFRIKNRRYNSYLLFNL